MEGTTETLENQVTTPKHARNEGNTHNKVPKKLTQQVFHPSLFNRTSPASAPARTMPSTSGTPLEEQSQDTTTWQRAPTLRLHKRKKPSDSPPSPPRTATSNRFEILAVDDEEVVIRQRDLKPPPLLLYGIEDVNKLSQTLETALQKSDYTFKIINKNQLRVSCNSVPAYKSLMSLVREKGLIGHTFTRKEERSYRIVIRNLHHTTPHTAIVEEIESTGNKVRGEIINARYGPDRKPTSTFFVNLEPGDQNPEVKKIRVIYNTSVIIEDPRKSNTIVQCMRCQQYGHSKNNCLRPYRCVKCAQAHKTSDCPKTDRNTPATCALCLGSHPANYKGCEVYREILDRKLKTRPKETRYLTQTQPKNDSRTAVQVSPKPTKPTMPSHEQIPYSTPHTKKKEHVNQSVPHTHQTQEHTQNKQNNNTKTSKSSYADRARINSHTTNTDEVIKLTPSIEELLTKQTQKVDTLIQQIGSLIGLIMMLIEKLT